MFAIAAIIGLAWPLQAQFVYVANDVDNTVSGYAIDRKTGALKPVPGSPFATGSVAFTVAVDPTAQFAYVVNVSFVNPPSPGTVSGYSIDRKTGALTPVPGSPFVEGVWPFSVAVDPTGQFAYVANLFSNTISGYAIDGKTGALTPVPGSPFAEGNDPFSVTVDPTGQFAYVANSLRNTISGYSIDRKTGALTPVPGSPFAGGDGPISVAVDPTGQFAYVANESIKNYSAGRPGTVSGYRIDRKTGALTPVPGSPFAGGDVPRSVTVDPTGQFAYVTNDYSNTISGYRIDRKTGALTPVPGSPSVGDGGPLSVAVDPTGQFA